MLASSTFPCYVLPRCGGRLRPVRARARAPPRPSPRILYTCVSEAAAITLLVFVTFAGLRMDNIILLYLCKGKANENQIVVEGKN